MKIIYVSHKTHEGKVKSHFEILILSVTNNKMTVSTVVGYFQ